MQKKKEEKKISKVKDGIEKLMHPTLNTPRTVGQKTSDWLTKWAGSWTFIIIFFAFLGLWMATSGTLILKYINGSLEDPYPFILLNLALSCLAAIQAPIILMSQNRTNQRDRQRAEYDYAVNRKAEREIQEIKKLLMNMKRK